MTGWSRSGRWRRRLRADEEGLLPPQLRLQGVLAQPVSDRHGGAAPQAHDRNALVLHVGVRGELGEGVGIVDEVPRRGLRLQVADDDREVQGGKEAVHARLRPGGGGSEIEARDDGISLIEFASHLARVEDGGGGGEESRRPAPAGQALARKVRQHPHDFVGAAARHGLAEVAVRVALEAGVAREQGADDGALGGEAQRVLGSEDAVMAEEHLSGGDPAPDGLGLGRGGDRQLLALDVGLALEQGGAGEGALRQGGLPGALLDGAHELGLVVVRDIRGDAQGLIFHGEGLELRREPLLLRAHEALEAFGPLGDGHGQHEGLLGPLGGGGQRRAGHRALPEPLQRRGRRQHRSHSQRQQGVHVLSLGRAEGFLFRGGFAAKARRDDVCKRLRASWGLSFVKCMASATFTSPPAAARSRWASAGESSVSSATMRAARARSFAFVGRTSTIRPRYTLPRQMKAVVVRALRISFVAVPAFSRVEPATNSGPVGARIRMSTRVPRLGGLQQTSTVWALRLRASAKAPST
ncbi:hypothetical protein STIAU_4818 [Stigmatella aurantiaca DW4/3-1]|uniref:Uncharacterized protein n=1 Tax=Stigmatella aurantiaca (strain DW4/3-1) TaxID=378806 RepID=Q08ZW9_STIAD|nr:hypothetical protein STIAU_4818 [Stigmatella aurantiaca DW4/3-1]